MGEDKKIDGKFKNNTITDIVEIISYIYINIYVITKTHTFVDLVIGNFGIQLHRNIVQESLLKIIVQGRLQNESICQKISSPNFILYIPVFVYMPSYRLALNNIY